MPVPEPTLPERPESLMRAAWRRFRRNPLAMGGLVVFVIFAILAILAPWIAPYNPASIDLFNSDAPPSWQHLLGTDDSGRDIFTRILYGSRVSMLVGVLVAIGSVLIGCIVGAVAGYFGGWLDTVLMRIIDVMLSLPALFINILVLAIFGASFYLMILILVLTSWMGVARLVRGEFLQLREMQYVEAAKAAGASSVRIMFNHLLRNATAPIIVNATLMVGGAILTESALSFLGLGVQPPQTSWGQMLNNAQEYMLTNPMLAVYPGVCIFLVVLSVNFIGDGIRDALDPRQKAHIPKRRIAQWRDRFLKSST
ncbi:MAG: ABC transporter permease [Firmicutes bacterium]|nr:ABC transporter permease [Bacillota bacterium]